MAANRATQHPVVVVANRLPVDRSVDADGEVTWATAPGGLVTALAPIMQSTHGAWVGWSGGTSEDGPELAPFDVEGIHVVPVPLSTKEVENYYEGFSNATLWPLYHDVIVPPVFHREWWQAYRRVNERFAEAADRAAAHGATVWVHDYQLQLVPELLRARRPDLRIGFFLHIPFPPFQLFAQLPWRGPILRGLLGADLLGFQRREDATSFLRACREALGLAARRGRIRVPASDGAPAHTAEVAAFPISIDGESLAELAETPEVMARAAEIREDLGHDRKIVLGVDRLDYTKGIGHRLKAYGELLADGRVDPATTVLVQVASPSRERVEEYQRLRDEVELTVGRLNGVHSTLERPAVVYLHQSYERTEMAALYRVADVMLVTPLRDGMNLVAKEYIACRTHDDGVLVLSEFTGAAVQLRQAIIVNPHDIAGLKDCLVLALEMTPAEQRARMRRLRRSVLTQSVHVWADDFLRVLAGERELPW